MMKIYLRLILAVGFFLCMSGIVHAENIWQDQNANLEKRLNIAYGYLDKGQGEQALSEAEEFIKNNLNSFDAYAVKTMVSLEMQIWDKAIESAKEMIRLKPDDFASHLGLGQAYGGKRLFNDAVNELNEAIQLNPNEPGAYYYLELAYIELGQKDKAREVHERLKNIDVQAAKELAALLR